MDNLNQQTSPSKPLSSSLPNQTALSSPPPPNPSKTFIILLLVMLIIIVGVGGYTLGIKHGKTVVQNQQTTPTILQPSPDVDPTANWKTYRNEEFGFEMKYPALYLTKEPLLKLGAEMRLCFQIEDIDNPQICNKPRIEVSVGLTEKTKKYYPTLEKFLDYLGEKFKNRNEMNINGHQAFKFWQPNEGFPATMAVIDGGKYIFILTYSTFDPNNPDILYGEVPEFDQILSTFKVLDKNTISWNEAMELIRSCQVKMASQTHSRNVDLTLKDGTIRITVEPKLDMVIEEAQSASTKCGFDISVETE